MNNWLQNFVQKNAWSLLVGVIAVVSVYTTMSVQLSNVEARVDELQSQVEVQTEILSRLVRLEERASSREAELADFKQNTERNFAEVMQQVGEIRRFLLGS